MVLTPSDRVGKILGRSAITVALIYLASVVYYSFEMQSDKGVFWTVGIIVFNALLIGCASRILHRGMKVAPISAGSISSVPSASSLVQQYIDQEIPSAEIIRQPIRAVDNGSMVGFDRHEFIRFCQKSRDHFEALLFLCGQPLLPLNDEFAREIANLLHASKVVIYAFMSEEAMNEFLVWDSNMRKQTTASYMSNLVGVDIDLAQPLHAGVNVAFLIQTREGELDLYTAFQTNTDQQTDRSLFYAEIPKHRIDMFRVSMHRVLRAVYAACQSQELGSKYATRVLDALSTAGISIDSIPQDRQHLKLVP
jgi:hypothetical protein